MPHPKPPPHVGKNMERGWTGEKGRVDPGCRHRFDLPPPRRSTPPGRGGERRGSGRRTRAGEA
uniref:Uncharacterized protein n=1 Tax=Oryza glumipatula TaxID=40148 RepID=A0A0D9ZZ77_9ORYZ